jgi:hypothetical protein
MNKKISNGVNSMILASVGSIPGVDSAITADKIG